MSLRRAEATAAPPPAAPAARRRDILSSARGGFGGVGIGRAGLGEQRLPVIDDVGRSSVNLHPGQCVAKNVAVRERALRPGTD